MDVKYLLRFDDITPEMNWNNFDEFRTLLVRKNIKPIIGVVPDNRDPKLKVDEVNPNFWSIIQQLQEYGWEVAQHGYHHLYQTQDGGLLGLSNKSEFAGISFEDQVEMLQKGREILTDMGLHTRLFMAPSHSFDLNTLSALEQLSFLGITDGYGLFPYRMKNLLVIPQLYATPRHFGFGVYTICIHLNSLTQKELDEQLRFIENNAHKIISVDEAILLENNTFWNRVFSALVLKFIRYTKQKINYMLRIVKINADNFQKDIQN